MPQQVEAEVDDQVDDVRFFGVEERHRVAATRAALEPKHGRHENSSQVVRFARRVISGGGYRAECRGPLPFSCGGSWASLRPKARAIWIMNPKPLDTSGSFATRISAKTPFGPRGSASAA